MAGRESVLAMHDLRVTFNPPTGPVDAIRGLDLAIHAGEVLGIVGESGSGKSVTFRSVLGLTPPSATTSGTITVGGKSGTPTEMAPEARAISAMVYQNPGAALNPVFTIGQQLTLVAQDENESNLADLLDQVGLPEPAKALDSYPHEFSGGMQQRAVIAMALAQRPKLLVADEPTTALDVTTETQILDLLVKLGNERQIAIAFISHDLGVIGKIADRVAVMRNGEVLETGATQQILTNPEHPYTQMLIASSPGARETATFTAADEPGLLEIDNLTVEYRNRDRRAGRKVRVIEGLGLTVAKGETVALVGESGSGKSTLANAVVGLVPHVEGSIRFDGQDLATMTRAEKKAFRSKVQVVFQNPLLSLSPRRTIAWQLHEPLRLYTDHTKAERDERIAELMGRLDLDTELLDRRPHELSGGQAQRVVLARALAVDPTLIVFDEPTSALDVSVQVEVLELLNELKVERELTYLFITHDLAVARHLADRIAVMQHGKIVELRETQDLFDDPQHPYTRTLLASSASLEAPAASGASRD